MITVYVWKPRGDAWGHASMQVNGGSPSGSLYISWWPRSAVAGGKRTVHAIRDREFAHDVHDEKRNPDHTIIFSALDETAIKKWWGQLQKGPHMWSTLSLNCSTVVAHAIHAGGGEDMVTRFDGWWNNWNIVWKPEDVLDYALTVRSGISTLGIWHCGSRDCPTHRSRMHECTTGVWFCGRHNPPCPGHKSPEDSCPRGTAWHCGSRNCPTHRNKADQCPTGVWFCGRRIPPCPGHSSPKHHCGFKP